MTVRAFGQAPLASRLSARTRAVLLIVPLLLAVAPIFVALSRLPEQPPSLGVWVLVALSALANVVVLTYHHAIPAHPKFLLRPWRRWVLRVHVASGTVELVSGLIACLWPSPAAGIVTAVAALGFHVPTALLQTRIVFGSRAVMVPSYLLCILTHAFCAGMLLTHPTSVMWAVYTFTIFNIYVWCRVYYYAFDLLRLFEGDRYTVAILAAGSTMLGPLLGSLGFLVLVGFVGLYIGLYRWLFVASDEAFHDFVHERAREGRPRTPAVQRPAFLVDPAADEAAFDALFTALDTDGDGVLSPDEVRHSLEPWTLAPAALDTYAEGLAVEGPVDRTTFWRRVWSIDAVRHHAHGRLAFERAATDHDRAELVFRHLDARADGGLDREDLDTLLLEWGLPPEETQACLRDIGQRSRGGRIEFDEFFHQMEPVWRFIYYHVLRIEYGRDRGEMIGRSLRVLRDAQKTAALRDQVRRSLLSRVPFLKGAAEVLIDDLAASATEMRYGPDEAVIVEGTVGDRFYVVASGRVRVTLDGLRLAELGPGACFGEGALLTDERRAATVTAIDETTLITVNRPAFTYLTEMYPHVRAQLVSLNQRHRIDDTYSVLTHWLLGRVPFLVNADEALLHDLAERLERVRVAAGQAVITEGEHGERFYVVEHGSMGVRRGGVSVAHIEAGECFGEATLLGDGTHSATVVATTDVRLLSLDRAAFEALVQRHPGLRTALAAMFPQRIGTGPSGPRDTGPSGPLHAGPSGPLNDRG